jgi:hypothetical protein
MKIVHSGLQNVTLRCSVTLRQYHTADFVTDFSFCARVVFKQALNAISTYRPE